MNNSAQTNPNHPDHIQWLSDFIRLEIVLWERVDNRLRNENKLSLAFFELLYLLLQESQRSLRVGDIARKLQVTVGGTSKLIDRIEREGFIQRENDPLNRRASLIVLTKAGERVVSSAIKTYEAEMKEVLDGVLNELEQSQMYDYVVRLLKAAKAKEPA